jgi:hypothetical protein
MSENKELSNSPLRRKQKGGAPKGNRNAWKHGRYARETVTTLRYLRGRIRAIRATVAKIGGGKIRALRAMSKRHAEDALQ